MNERDEEVDFNNQEFVSFFLIQQIKLLCEFKKFDEVISALENKDIIYPFKETLKLCLENNIYDAIIYLYKINGESSNAVEQCLERLQNNFKEFISDIEDNRDLNAQNINEKYVLINRKYLNQGIQVCEYNSDSLDDEIWFKLLNKLYEFEGKLNKLIDKYKNNNEKENIIEHFHNQIIQDIKDLMEKLCSFVGITKILNIVSEKNKNAGLKEFKDLIMKILFNYGRQTNIFETTKNLLTNLIFQNELTFQNMNQEGGLLDFDKCDKCHKKFNDKSNNDSILLFKCQHIFHFHCSDKERNGTSNELNCPICSEFEINQSINTRKSLIMKRNLKLIEGTSNKKEMQGNFSVNKQNLLKKLKRFDTKLKAKTRTAIENNLKVY